MIKQQFYSDKLNKYFATEKEAVQAEKVYDEKLKQEQQKKLEAQRKEEAFRVQRAKDAKEVEDAIRFACDANEKAEQKLTAFINKYGSYHATYTEPKNIFSDIFKIMLGL